VPGINGTASKLMTVFYLGMLYDYGDPSRGWSFEERNFYQPLERLGRERHWRMRRFDFMQIGKQFGREKMSDMLWDAVCKEKPEVLISILFDPQNDPSLDVIGRISQETNTTTINWFCDDHWRFENYSRGVAPHFNYVVTTDSQAIPKYRSIGMAERVIKSQWACNHRQYHPIPCVRDFDVSFVGQPHGNRAEIVRRLTNQGIGLRVFGHGWDNAPRLPFHEMVRTFNRSRINLNLSNSSQAGHRQQIKGRNFEIPGSGGFMLTSEADNLEEYYTDKKEVAIFRSEEELTDLIRYYLQHDDERKAIARAGYDRTMREHTWERRWNDILNQCDRAGARQPVLR